MGSNLVVDASGQSGLVDLPARLHVYGNGGVLTLEQFAEVKHALHRFDLAARASVGDYLVAHRTLPDGSKLRLESLRVVATGLYGRDAHVWPAPTGGVKPIELAGYVILPRDETHSDGWDKGAKPDSARAYLAAKKTLVIPPRVELHVKLKAGAVDWRSSKGVILTYDHNGNNRYATELWGTVFSGTNNDSASTGVYYKGTKITTPVGVSAAAIFGGFLIIIGANTVRACHSPINKIDASLARGVFLPEVAPTWSTITVSGSVASARRASAWHFKPDGSVAAAAFVDSSFGVGTWSMDRMRTEALTMMKRYLTFAVVAGVLTCTVSDTAYTCEAIGCTGTSGLATTYTSIASSYTLSGKRLWGVDWDASGNEIAISFQRTGSGTVTHAGAGASGTNGWTQHWGVYANATELFRASSHVPDVSVGYNGAGGFAGASMAGGSYNSNEYVAVHVLDARYGLALVERLTMAYTHTPDLVGGSVPDPLGFESGTAATPFDTISSQLELRENGALIMVHAETLTEFFPACYASTVLRSGPAFGGLFDPRYGQSFVVDGPDGDYNRFLGVAYPQCGNYAGETVYEQLYIDSGLTSRSTYALFDCYPNQVSDALSKLMFRYSPQIDTWTFDYRWPGAGDPYVGDPYTLPFGADLNAFVTFGQYRSIDYFLLKAGVTVPGPDSLHFIATARDLFVQQYRSVMKKLQQRNHSLAQTGVAPTYFASAFTRPTTADPWSESDILATVSAAVTADGNSPDSATFHIDPVRLV